MLLSLGNLFQVLKLWKSVEFGYLTFGDTIEFGRLFSLKVFYLKFAGLLWILQGRSFLTFENPPAFRHLS